MNISRSFILILPLASTSGLGAEQAASPIVFTQWKTYTTSDGLAGNEIRDILVEGGDVWVGSDGGLSLLRDGTWRRWTTKEGFPAYSARSIALDPITRDMWIGTWGKGLVRFSGGRFDRFDQINAGLAGNMIFDVAQFEDRIWAATNAGVSEFDPVTNSWQIHFARTLNGPQVAVTTFAKFNGDLLASASGRGLLRYDHSSAEWSEFSQQRRERSKEAGTVIDLAHYGDTVWMVLSRSIEQLDSQGVPIDRRSLFAPNEGMYTTFAAAPNDNELWLGTRYGLWVCCDWNRDTWVSYRKRENDVGGTVEVIRNGEVMDSQFISQSLPDNRTHCVAFGTDGVWVGTANGLAYASNPEKRSVRKQSQSMQKNNPRPARQQRSSITTPNDNEFGTAGIGFLGPTSRTIALPGSNERQAERADLLAVQIAVDLANKTTSGGKKKPFEMAMQIPGYATYGWGTAEDEFPRFSSQPHVAGLIGHLAADDHLASAVAVRTEVPIVTAAPFRALDAESDTLFNPWIFQCQGGQPRQHRLLINYLIDHLNKKRLVVVRTAGEAANRHLDWWSAHAQRRGHAPVADVAWSSESETFDKAFESIQDAQPDAILTWCDLETAAAIARSLREQEMEALFVGGPQTANSRFLKLVGPNPGEVIALHRSAPRPSSHSNSPLVAAFIEEYSERNTRGGRKRPPNLNALRSYEATDHLLNAVSVAGANREGVRQVLELMERSPTGERHYERRHPTPGLWMAKLTAGRWDWHLIEVKD